MKKAFLLPVLAVILMGLSSAWSIDGVCDNSVEAERTLIDFTGFSTNVTTDVVNTVLWSETDCFNITFVNSTGVGIALDYQCLYDKTVAEEITGEYLIFDKNQTYYECEALGWDSETYPICDPENKLLFTFNESDWEDYDFAVWEFENANDLWGSYFTAISWRGANLFGYENSLESKWEFNPPQMQLRLYNSFYVGLYNATTGELFSPLGRTEEAGSSDMINSDYTGEALTFYPYDQWHNITKDLNFIQSRWHIDSGDSFARSDLYDFGETSFNFILKSFKLVRKENQYDSTDCAVKMTIDDINTNPYFYGNWIVNVTGSRVPTNFDIVDYSNDYLETLFVPYGYDRLRRDVLFTIADSSSNAIRVGDGNYPLASVFENVSMWERINVIGKVAYPSVINLIYSIEETGITETIPYHEEIPDLWDYMSSEAVAGFNYFLRPNDTEYGCKFVKVKINKGDYFFYDYGSNENAGLSFLFSTEDLCSTGFGCELSFEVPYNSTFPVNDDYDMISIGVLCKQNPYEFSYTPSGLAFDEYGFVGDGICSLDFEYYKGDFDDQPCRISPTWYAVYSAEGLTGYSPLILGLGFGLLLLGSVLIAVGYSRKQAGEDSSLYNLMGIVAIAGFGMLLLFHLSIKAGLIPL